MSEDDEGTDRARMRAMHKTATVAVFAVFGIAGPLLRLAVPPMTGSDRLDSFVHDLVLLLWPAQVFGVMERTLGTIRAAFVAVGANLLLFTAVGFVAAISARWTWALLVWQGFVLACLVWWALLWTGFAPEFLNWSALALAGVVYSVAFAIARRKVRLDRTLIDGAAAQQ